MEEFVNWLEQSWVILAGIAGGLGILLGLKKSIKEIKSDINKPFDNINKRFDEIEQKIDSKHHNDEVVIDSLLTMQRGDILNDAEKYIKQGYATLHQKETIQARFESYQKLGGNSFVHDLMNQVQNLPLEKQTKKKKKEVSEDTIF